MGKNFPSFILHDGKNDQTRCNQGNEQNCCGRILDCVYWSVLYYTATIENKESQLATVTYHVLTGKVMSLNVKFGVR